MQLNIFENFLCVTFGLHLVVTKNVLFEYKRIKLGNKGILWKRNTDYTAHLKNAVNFLVA